MVLGRSTMVLERFTMVTGRSTMVSGRSAMAMEGLFCSRAFQKHITLMGQRLISPPSFMPPLAPHRAPPTTGFKFMANKQFRMEKNGNISVRWYLTLCSQKPIRSIFMGKNHSTNFFWMTFLVFWRFLDQIRLQKTGF